jgi:dipeptidyl aminopeptidase/acylaminoacyl peptidase
MVVLQGEEDCPHLGPGEGPCVVSGYEAVVHKLVSEGVVDPDRVGIIGFSRTCFYVMEILIAGLPQVKAASITDGYLVGYLEYMMSQPASGIVNEADAMIGAKPFGEGLQRWLKRSPLFNLEHVNAPLLVVGMGPSGVLQMWEPYAGLRHLKKPVDLIMLNTDEHVLTTPAVRVASQGGSVDWFRFWLQDWEDPDPAKVGQYKRWRELRKLQEESTMAK